MGDYVLENREFRRLLKHRRAMNGRACGHVFWLAQRPGGRRELLRRLRPCLQNLSEQIESSQFGTKLCCIGKMVRGKAIEAGAHDIVEIIIDEDRFARL